MEDGTNKILFQQLRLILLMCAVPMIFFLLLSINSSAQDDGCSIEATKSAPGSGGFEFLFQGTADGEPIDDFTLADGQSTGGNIPEGVSVVITEAPQNGYRFGGIDCDAEPGIVITDSAEGFSINCVDETAGSASCVIRNVSIVSGIPTLSQWGLIAMAELMGIAGLVIIRRRKITA